jgi:hypothetical protein
VPPVGAEIFRISWSHYFILPFLPAPRRPSGLTLDDSNLTNKVAAINSFVIFSLKIEHGSIPGGSLKRSLGMAKLRKQHNHPQILRI